MFKTLLFQVRCTVTWLKQKTLAHHGEFARSDTRMWPFLWLSRRQPFEAFLNIWKSEISKVQCDQKSTSTSYNFCQFKVAGLACFQKICWMTLHRRLLIGSDENQNLTQELWFQKMIEKLAAPQNSENSTGIWLRELNENYKQAKPQREKSASTRSIACDWPWSSLDRRRQTEALLDGVMILKKAFDEIYCAVSMRLDFQMQPTKSA